MPARFLTVPLFLQAVLSNLQKQENDQALPYMVGPWRRVSKWVTLYEAHEDLLAINLGRLQCFQMKATQ